MNAAKTQNLRGTTTMEEEESLFAKNGEIFTSFYEDMHKNYAKGLMLDRIDNDGPYTAENCRWASSVLQANNKRTNRQISFNGETHTIAEWARIKGINYKLLRERLRCNWDFDRAIKTPCVNPRKLTYEEVNKIRSLQHSMSQQAIGQLFHVSQTVISKIMQRYTYRHIA